MRLFVAMFDFNVDALMKKVVVGSVVDVDVDVSDRDHTMTIRVKFVSTQRSQRTFVVLIVIWFRKK